MKFKSTPVVFLTAALTLTLAPSPCGAQAPKPAKKETLNLEATAIALAETAVTAKSTASAAVNEQNFQRALDAANKAIAADATAAKPWLIRGRIYSEMPAADAGKQSANRDLALKDYDKAIALKADFTDAWNLRGNLRLQIAASVSTTNAMLEGFAKGAGVKKDIKVTDGSGSTAKQVLDLALVDFNRAVALAPTASNYFGRANAYKAREEFEAARRDYEQALKLNPALQAAKIELAALPAPMVGLSGDWELTNTLGKSDIKFQLQFSNDGGTLTGLASAGTSKKTPLQNIARKLDRSVSFRLVTGNGATLDCTGTIAADYRKMSGQSTITFNGQSAKGTFSAEQKP